MNGTALQPASQRGCSRTLGLLLTSIIPLTAQSFEIEAVNELPGTSGTVWAVTSWDPDGPGPAAPLVVFGGGFTMAGGVNSPGVVGFDPATRTWVRFGDGLSLIHAMVVMPNGQLVAGGAFGVHVWTGSQWAPIPNAPLHVNCMLVDATGGLVIGGGFTNCGALQTNGIARWSGAGWASFGTGLLGTVHPGSVSCLGISAAGRLVAGGYFPGKLAEWDPALGLWIQIGAGFTYQGFASQAGVFSMVNAPNGDLIVGGLFDQIGTFAASRIARWDGSNWSTLGVGIGPGFNSHGAVNRLRYRANGNLMALGMFATAGGASIEGVAEWDGSTWSGFGTPAPLTIHDGIELANGDLIVAGTFNQFLSGGPTGYEVRHVMIHSGNSWRALTTSLVGNYYAVTHLDDGRVAVGGSFSMDGQLRRLAVWDDGVWSGLGAAPDGDVVAIHELPGGGLVVGGAFTSIGGVPATRVARWTGSGWVPMGVGFDDVPRQFVTLHDGSLVAGGYFTQSGSTTLNGIARWDGASWQPIANSAALPGYFVLAMTVAPNGDLFVVVNPRGYTPQYSSVAQWDGVTWRIIGSPFMPQGAWIWGIGARPNGSIAVYGTTPIGGNSTACLAIWDGQSWQSGGSGPHRMVPGPQGDLFGTYQGGFSAASMYVNRWSTTTGSVLVSTDGTPQLLSWHDRHGLLIAGGIGAVGLSSNEAVYAAGIVRLRPIDAADVQSIGVGGSTTAGALQLTSSTFPYLRGQLHTRCTGVAPNTSAFALLSMTSPAVPLNTLHPLGAPGILLLANADDVRVLVPQSGRVTAHYPVPASPALIGAVCYHQVIVFEHGPGNSVTSINASNGLRLVVGDF